MRGLLHRAGGRGLARAVVATTAAITATALALTMAQPARAADPVAINQAEMQHRLFSGYMRAHNPGPTGLRDMVLSADLVGWRDKNPGATSAQMLSHMAYMRTYLSEHMEANDVQRPAYEYMQRVLNVMSNAPGAAIASSTMREVMDAALGKQLKTYGSEMDFIAGSQAQYAAFSKIYEVEDLIWGRVTERGQFDADFRAAWDGAIGAGFNVSSNATVDQLMADPAIATYVNVQALLELTTQQSSYIEEGQRQLTTALDTIKQQNASTLERLAQLNAAYPVSSSGPRPTVQIEITEKAAAADRQKIIDGAGTAIDILATLIGFADPRAGKITAGVGKAAIQVASAINAFIPAVAGLSLGEAIFSMSTLTLTGNVLGAITSLLPLFENVPTPEAQMLEQLKSIRQDIASLSTAMNDRFDRLESGLTTVYSDMLTKFDEIMALQNASSAKLATLESALLRLSPQLDMWGAENIKAQQQLALNDTNLVINQYIDYKSRYGQDIPSFNGGGDHYTYPEAVLRNTALTIATHAPMTGPSTSWSTADPVATLGAWEANGSLGYLEWLAASTYGLPTSSTLTKPNPATWAYAARAYGLLEVQNPGYAAQVSATQPGSIIANGQDILAVNRALSQPKAPGTDGKRTNVLFTGLNRDYLAAVTDLKAKLNAVRTTYDDGKNYNLFAGIDQPMPAGVALTEPGGMQSCGGSGDWITRPANATLTYAPSVYAFAQYAHPDKPRVNLCYDASFVNVKHSFTTKFNIDKASLRVQVRLRVVWGTMVRDLRVWTMTTPSMEIYRDYRDSGEVVTDIRLEDLMAQWDSTYRSMFETTATITAEDTGLTPEIRTRMTNFLAGRQAGYYSQVYSDLQDPAKDLGRANAQLTKMAKLIKAYSALGFGYTMQRDDLMRSALYGANRILADDGDGFMLSDTFGAASQAYAACAPASRGAPCTAGNGAFNPLTGQRYFTDCAAGGWTPEMTDPIGDCLIGKAKIRQNLLADRYEAASGRIAAGTYTEGMPEVVDLIMSLSTIDASVRG